VKLRHVFVVFREFLLFLGDGLLLLEIPFCSNLDQRCRLVLTSAVVIFLFLAGLWFTEAIINGPNFHPKLTLAAPTICYSVSSCVSS